jgi:spore coat polysaccharide biosynthesis predicted glycosyltransferase SpsG
MKVLYRADGSPEIGTGHIIRGLILRRRLESLGAQVCFVTGDLPWGAQRLREANCNLVTIPADADQEAEREVVCSALQALPADVCVMDVLETSDAQTRALKEKGCRLVCLDDVGPGRLNADAIVNVLEVEPAREAVAERGIALYEGPEYAALPEEYAQRGIGERKIPARVRHIIITLGGADPAGLAPKAASAARRALQGRQALGAFEQPHVLLLVGPASQQRQEVERALRGAEACFTLTTSLPSLFPALRQADVGIIAGGLTMHEALAVGLPCIALCQPVRHQAQLAQRFAHQGAMLTLGPGAAVSEEQIAETLLRLAADIGLRRGMAARGPQLVDGRGAQRTAEVIRRLGASA